MCVRISLSLSLCVCVRACVCVCVCVWISENEIVLRVKKQELTRNRSVLQNTFDRALGLGVSDSTPTGSSEAHSTSPFDSPVDTTTLDSPAVANTPSDPFATTTLDSPVVATAPNDPFATTTLDSSVATAALDRSVATLNLLS